MQAAGEVMQVQKSFYTRARNTDTGMLDGRHNFAEDSDHHPVDLTDIQETTNQYQEVKISQTTNDSRKNNGNNIKDHKPNPTQDLNLAKEEKQAAILITAGEKKKTEVHQIYL